MSWARSDILTAIPDANPRDGRFLNIVRGMESIGQEGVGIEISVPDTSTSFSVSVFDGDCGFKWDRASGTSQVVYDQCWFRLYADPAGDGTNTGGLVAQYDGATMPDDGWFTAPVANVAAAHNATAGAFIYRLVVAWKSAAFPNVMNNFKMAATGAQVYLLGNSTFSFHGFGPVDPVGLLAPPTSYDGSWRFLLDVPAGTPVLDLWDGDFDHATDARCFSTDPAENLAAWNLAAPGGGRKPLFPTAASTLAEDAIVGDPPDNLAIYQVGGPIRYEVTSPPYPDLVTGLPTSWVVTNTNPSGNREWELFRAATVADPTVRAVVPALPGGFYKWEILDADGRNTLFIHPRHRMYAGAVLGDYVWRDDNQDGVQDPGEPGVAGVTVNLLDGSGAFVATKITDASGVYLFAGLAPGDYIVEFVLPGGYARSPKDAAPDDAVDSDADVATGRSGQVTLVAGQIDRTIDAGIYKVGAVGDYVWHDLNMNGIQDGGELGVPNVPVQLIDGTNTVIATTTTGPDGRYIFDGLASGSYRVKFDLPPDYFVSPYGAGGQSNSSWAQSDGSTLAASLAPGGHYLDFDAGIYQNASIGDRVWLDADSDGVQDAGEPGIEGVLVELYDTAGTLTNWMSTGPDGIYVFDGLQPGTYTVAVDPSTLPAGYLQTYDLDGLGTPHAATATLASAENRRDVDFGYVPTPGNGATRTIGYWATHLRALTAAVTAGAIKLGDLVPTPTIGDVEAIMWGNIAKQGRIARSPLGQARMQLGQQLVAACANVYLLGTEPGSIGLAPNLLALAVAALNGTDVEAIKSYIGKLDEFNNKGDAVQFTPTQATIAGPADPQGSKLAADKDANGVIDPGPAFL